MQRTEKNGGVVISCDFCGTDWDQDLPMIEGHHGSVICVECLKVALVNTKPHPSTYHCTMCIRDSLPEDLPRWLPQAGRKTANVNAIICQECVDQAARAFHRDKDGDWTMPGQ